MVPWILTKVVQCTEWHCRANVLNVVHMYVSELAELWNFTNAISCINACIFTTRTTFNFLLTFCLAMAGRQESLMMCIPSGTRDLGSSNIRQKALAYASWQGAPHRDDRTASGCQNLSVQIRDGVLNLGLSNKHMAPIHRERVLGKPALWNPESDLCRASHNSSVM